MTLKKKKKKKGGQKKAKLCESKLKRKLQTSHLLLSVSHIHAVQRKNPQAVLSEYRLIHPTFCISRNKAPLF